MRLTKRRRTTRPEMDMTPMIDIVFLLIIFFMTVSQISEAKKERINLPKQPGSEEQVPTVMTINVMQDGELRVSGESISLAGLVTLVDRELIRLGDRSLLTIVVRADQLGNCRMPSEILRTLAEMGILRVRIAVEAQ